jgi:hypothetical protein
MTATVKEVATAAAKEVCVGQAEAVQCIFLSLFFLTITTTTTTEG